MVTGCQWNQLREKYGKWNSVYRFHLRWAQRNIFGELLKKHVEQHGDDGRKVVDATHIKVHHDACHCASSSELQGFSKTKGGRNSKLSAVSNGSGKALGFDLMPGNHADITAAIRILGDVSGQVVLADKGYDRDGLRDQIFANGGGANIPGRKNRKSEVPYFKSIRKERYVIECLFQRLKRFRRINTRYDRLAATFMAFVMPCSSSGLVPLSILSTRPRATSSISRIERDPAGVIALTPPTISPRIWKRPKTSPQIHPMILAAFEPLRVIRITGKVPL